MSSKAIDCTTAGVNAKYGFGLIMMCQCKLTDYNKCIILVCTVDGGEVVCVGACRNSLYFQLNFAVYLK